MKKLRVIRESARCPRAGGGGAVVLRLLLVAALAVTLTSCGPDDAGARTADEEGRSGGGTPPSGNGSSQVERDGGAGAPVVPTTTVGVKELEARAEAYWAAQQREDWLEVYRFQVPTVREEYTAEEFAAWSEQNAPFTIDAYQLGRAITDGEMGWVEVSATTGVRRFPEMPSRESQRWEKWKVVLDEWYPIPPTDVTFYPESPALRDAAAEARLRERFLQAWEARRTLDWDRLYELSDPRTRPAERGPTPTLDEVPHEFLSYKIFWVEAIGDRGKVRVQYEYRLTDPNLTKMPPQFTVVSDRWERVDGEWYLNKDGPVE